MSVNSFFIINSPSVISEIIEGEAVLVNLDNGIYYSMDHVGADVWNLIEHGLSLDQIVEQILDRYEGDHEEIIKGVQVLFGQLLSEELILTGEKPEAGQAVKNRFESPSKSGEKALYVQPVLNKYTDMEDLLLLDPIHEVDESGWPNPQIEAN